MITAKILTRDDIDPKFEGLPITSIRTSMFPGIGEMKDLPEVVLFVDLSEAILVLKNDRPGYTHRGAVILPELLRPFVRGSLPYHACMYHPWDVDPNASDTDRGMPL